MERVESHRTPRLLLRQWREEDLAPFAELNADPEVRHFFPSVLTREASDALAASLRSDLSARGWGLWAVERRDTGSFLGFTGLTVASADLPVSPSLEVGWRLARSAWGHGYATEAALAALRVGFADLGLAEVVSFTAAGNTRSRAVMERLGMTRDPSDDFDHPALPPGSALRRHVLYRLRRTAR